MLPLFDFLRPAVFLLR